MSNSTASLCLKERLVIPSKNQWKSWSLPSKYSALGLLLAVVSTFSMIGGWFPLESQTKIESVAEVGRGEPINMAPHIEEITSIYDQIEFKPISIEERLSTYPHTMEMVLLSINITT